MARLDRLNEGKEVAQLGAAIGREFSHELLSGVGVLDAGTLGRGLSQLLEGELLFKKGRAGQVSYLFKHALIENAAYSSLAAGQEATVPPPDRRGLRATAARDGGDAAPNCSPTTTPRPERRRRRWPSGRRPA